MKLEEHKATDRIDKTASWHNCNDCGKDYCRLAPKWGEPVALNCPLWINKRNEAITAQNGSE